MATIDFPASPTAGQLYGFGLRIWQWNGSGWNRVINANQVVAVFVAISSVDFSDAALPQPVLPTFSLLTHI